MAGALLAFLAVYVAAAAWFGDRVPRGTTVSGVAVGGQSADDATATLTTALGSVAAKPIVLTSTAGKVRTTPKALGLQVDVRGTVDGLVGFSLSPAAMWAHVAGGSAQPAVVTVDDAAFAATVDKARGKLDAKPVEGAISLKGGKVTVKAPVTGTTTDVPGTADAVRRWWPGERTVEVAASAAPPKVTADELARVRSEFADIAVSGPVTVVGEREVVHGRPQGVRPRGRAHRRRLGRPSPLAPTRRSWPRSCTRQPRRPTSRSRPRTPSSPSRAAPPP